MPPVGSCQVSTLSSWISLSNSFPLGDRYTCKLGDSYGAQRWVPLARDLVSHLGTHYRLWIN